MKISQRVPVNLITGFLGAGKTTAIKHLLAQGRGGERWAVLVNEFGKVGIDQSVLAADEVVIREVPGGCLCCTNNLPLQMGLSQLLAKANPSRILIEPTGLGHPARVLELLRESHWRETLDVQATITLVDARELADPRVLEHETFRAQIEAADVLVFSKDDALTDTERERARAFAADLLPPKSHIHFMANGELPRAWLELPGRAAPLRRSLLHVPMLNVPMQNGPTVVEINEPPYHYSELVGEAAIAGWVFPRDWVFTSSALLNVLFGLHDTLRVKGIFHTDQGWIFFNATRYETAVNSEVSRADNRLEIIAPVALDWASIEQGLLSARASVIG